MNNGIKHILTAPYSPTTTGKVERLHKTMRKEFFSQHSFDTIEHAQAGLDAWVDNYNYHREHQAIGDVAPIRRFELAEQKPFEIIDGDVAVDEPRHLVRTSSVGASTNTGASASSSTAITLVAISPAKP